ncbi:MAG TPA: hypothetical protein VIE43_13560 [Thermoanaerobaculia bacterium]|jgi:hypothetical protein|nr:hypothetical protein [Thermoanaerobaculia bacterium]
MFQLARIPPAALLLAVLSGGALPAQTFVPTPISCPFAGTANAVVYDGLYVAGYQGTNLSLVTLAYRAGFSQQYGITLTAHRNTFDGPVIGTPQTAIVNLPTTGEAPVTFDFRGAPVTPGDTIAFTQDLAIYGTTGALVYFDEGFAGAGINNCAQISETVGTLPPLTLVPNGGAGITMTQKDLTHQSCIPSDTVLCVDDFPGDQRFQVTASFHTAQDGGLSGTAQAVPLAQLGTTHGGLFWFFTPDNPEMLVKILNGCSSTDHFWAYITAGTNVAFTIKVEDTFRANISKTYTNADLTPARPIQDTLALASCHDCAVDADCRAGFLCCPYPAGRRNCVQPPNGVCQLIP